MNRRRFLQSVSIATGGISLLDWPAWAASKNRLVPRLHRWFPLFPTPREIWVVQSSGDIYEGLVLESAIGLAALGLRQGHSKSLIYEEVQHDGYKRWFEEYCRANSPKLVHLSLDEVLTRLLEAKLIRGHLLFRYEQSDRPLHSDGKLNESANVATSLAAAYKAVTVSEELAARMEKLGLKQLLDVRERSEKWCLSQADFSRSLLGTADPKTRHARSLMIALNAFVCCGRGEVYEQALGRCLEDSPVLGWGCEAEDKQTIPSSRRSLFQTATNWCLNLPVFSSDAVGKGISVEQLRYPHPQHWSSLDWGDGLHHVNFTLSDGDNVQWMMSSFTSGGEASSYYGHPKRGIIPFTWGLPVPSLCQLSPRTLVEILGKATTNDDFIQFSGGGYFYPDLYGKARGTTRALELHAERLRAYMDLTGIRILAFNFQDWDEGDAQAACEIFASKLPGLLGIFAFQYYPYSAGKGAIHWVKGLQGDEIPIVSCRFTIWAQTGRPRDGTPAAVAKHLNALPKAGETTMDDAFSWVMIHAWSRFRHASKDAPLDAEEKGVPQDKVSPDSARGYEPGLWAAERLDAKVKPVTASELLTRIRLRLRPRTTLTSWLADLQINHMHLQKNRKISTEIQALLPKTNHDATTARHCFELLKSMRH
jgi:hypothetical protein